MPTNPVFRFAPNGANRPLHQDRQVLRAEDLALEQATQDAMLARARRYLHGWGIVAGLLPEAPEGDAPLRVGPGYGVTPTGEEVFLPGAVDLPGVAEAVRACCGPGAVGCEVIDPEARAAATDDGPVTAWLVARPASREGAPRPGVPPDCAHPSARLLPSRRCGGVEFALLCDLPDRHRPPAPDCEALAPFLCPPPRAEAEPLPWEAPPGADDSLLVIARLTLADGALSVGLGDRRRLLPVWMVQDWIAACLCPALGRLGEEPEPPTRPEPPLEDDGSDDPIRPRPTLVTDIGNDILVTRLPDPGRDVLIDPPPIRDDLATLTLEATPGRDDLVLPTEEVIGMRDRLAADVQAIPGIGATRATALTEAGIRTEGEFLTAQPTVLAETLGVSVDRVTDMKRELSTRYGLGLRFR